MPANRFFFDTCGKTGSKPVPVGFDLGLGAATPRSSSIALRTLAATKVPAGFALGLGAATPRSSSMELRPELLAAFGLGLGAIARWSSSMGIRVVAAGGMTFSQNVARAEWHSMDEDCMRLRDTLRMDLPLGVRAV